jgi:N-acetylmuramoyl-L-alanine amidase
MRNRWKIAFGLTVASLIIVMVVLFSPLNVEMMTMHFVTKADVLLLDPGHGGIDGGAEAANGVCEKDINLAIAFAIKELAEADGWTVVMTREEDVGLYPERDRQSIRSLKTADLLERKRIIEKVRPLLAVSIHLNSFKQDTSVHGAQTFYPSGNAEENILEDSKRLAEVIQANLIAGMADGTDREALAKRDVMLFKNPPVPIAIVECGFLSNWKEANLLVQEAYQRKLAQSIYQGILEYSGKEGANPLKVIDTRGDKEKKKSVDNFSDMFA